MAESDPKKIRPFGNTSDRRSLDSEEDPLVELARIVSEDSGFYGSRSNRPQPAAEEPGDRSAYSADLESELLQEVESSFAKRHPSMARSAPSAPPAGTRPQNPPPSTAGDDPDELLRSIEQQLSAFERRSQTAPPPAPPPDQMPVRQTEERWDTDAEMAPPDEPQVQSAAPDLIEELHSEQEDEDRLAAEARERIARMRPTEAPDRPSVFAPRLRPVVSPERSAAPPPRIRPVEGTETVAARPQPRLGAHADRSGADEADPDRLEEPRAAMRLPLRRRDSPVAPPVEEDTGAGSEFAGGAARGWDDVASPQRTVAAEDARVRPLRPPQPDYRGELRTTFGGLEEARASARGQHPDIPPLEAELAGELEPSYSDPTFGGHWREEPDPGHDRFGEVGRRAAAVAAPDPDPEADDFEPRRSRAGLLAAAALLGVVVVGGAALMYLRSGEDVPSGPPPVIAAADGEVKIEPPAAQAEADGETVGEAVYNRVAGNVPPAEEQVVDGAEEPREISRIVLPAPNTASDDALVRSVGEDAEGTAAGVAAEPAEAAAADDSPLPAAASPVESATSEIAPTSAPIGPRRVRTYIVRPDGTIEESAAAPAEEASPDPAPEPQVAAVAQPDSEPIVPVRVPTTDINGTAETPIVVPNPARTAAASPQAAEPAPEVTAAAEPPAPAEAPAPPPAPASEPPAEVAAASPAPEPAPAPTPTPAIGDGYVVQVSSQRTMADAQSSWASLQRQFSSVLGGMQADIQSADLGERGIFYRVRVGPWASRAEAIVVCERLQAAGGSCFVTQ